MRIIVLGSAAGGGFPQWNCACRNCRRARKGEPAAKPRTQCSLAVSADGERWCLLNASPDLRAQIEATPALQPRYPPRHSPIEAVVLTNGDVDHVGGLLNLREGQPFRLHATRSVLTMLDDNPIFSVLSGDLVERRAVALGERIEVVGGLLVELFAVGGKVPLYLEGEAPTIGGETEDTVGVRVEHGSSALLFVPCCAGLPRSLMQRVAGAELLFFDGSFWQDDEMIRAGTGLKTGQRMGHMSISGPHGSLAGLADIDVARKIYIHVNNTNPILLEDSPERATVAAAGWEVAYDGMDVELPCA